MQNNLLLVISLKTEWLVVFTVDMLAELYDVVF